MRVLAWHFSENMTLRDGRPITVGKWMKLRPEDWVDGERRCIYNDEIMIIRQHIPIMCKVGFHASRNACDAFKYFRGDNPTVERVEIQGKVHEGDDKLVGTQRRVLAALDSDTTVRIIKLWGCEGAINSIKNTKYSARSTERSIKKIERIKEWIKGNGSKLKPAMTDTIEVIHLLLAHGLGFFISYGKEIPLKLDKMFLDEMKKRRLP